MDYLKKKGIYSEVAAHEWTHLHLTTSTTIGHALMFLASSGLRGSEGYKHLYTALMLMSWEAQEGAATLTEWQVAEATRPGTTMSRFRNTLPPDYQIAFDIFNSTSQVILAPECYWMKNIVANALAQFALNIDIMPRLMLLIEPNERMVQDMGDFLNSQPGHPQKRIKRVQMELGEPSSTLRNLRCEQIYERLKEGVNIIESKFPGLLHGRNYHVSEASIESRMLINDKLNQMFLRYFVDITGLPISVYHARDAGIQ